MHKQKKNQNVLFQRHLSNTIEIDDDLRETCKVAIKALKQEPTTKNDLGVDCIDRNSIKYYSGTGGYMYASKGEIDKLPSVTPQVRIKMDKDEYREEVLKELRFALLMLLI